MNWWSWSSIGWRLAQGFAGQRNAVGVVDQAIQDRVGQGRVADDFIPVVDRDLAGDDQRAGVVAVLDDLQQSRRCSGVSGSGPQSSRISRSTRASWRISRA
jgi:hypothetical protein